MNKPATYYLPVKLIDKLKAESSKTGQPQSKIITAALEAYFNKGESK